MLFLRLLDGSPTRTVLLFLSTQAYIIITKMWLCTVTVCVGVLRALWVYGIDFCRTKREEQESEVSQLRGERVTQQIPDIFSVRRCGVYRRLSRYISKNSAGTRSGCGNQRRRLIDDHRLFA